MTRKQPSKVLTECYQAWIQRRERLFHLCELKWRAWADSSTSALCSHESILMQGMMQSDEMYQGAKAATANAMAWAALYGDDACSWLEARMAERSG